MLGKIFNRLFGNTTTAPRSDLQEELDNISQVARNIIHQQESREHARRQEAANNINATVQNLIKDAYSTMKRPANLARIEDAIKRAVANDPNNRRINITDVMYDIVDPNKYFGNHNVNISAQSIAYQGASRAIREHLSAKGLSVEAGGSHYSYSELDDYGGTRNVGATREGLYVIR